MKLITNKEICLVLGGIGYTSKLLLPPKSKKDEDVKENKPRYVSPGFSGNPCGATNAQDEIESFKRLRESSRT